MYFGLEINKQVWDTQMQIEFLTWTKTILCFKIILNIFIT